MVSGPCSCKISAVLSEFGQEIYLEASKAFRQITGEEQELLDLISSPDSRQILENHIMAVLTKWWTSDPEQIPRLLYRIDVDERQARAAFESDAPIPGLASLILLRLEQTAQSRIAYRNRNAGN